MDGPREELLARAALAVDQDRGVRRRHLLDLGRDLLELAALADDLRQAELVGELLLEQDVLRGHAGGVERSLDQHQQMVRVKGLGQKIIGPLLHGLDRGLDRAEGGHHDDRQERVSSFTALSTSKPSFFGSLRSVSTSADALVGKLPDALGAVPGRGSPGSLRPPGSA